MIKATSDTLFDAIEAAVEGEAYEAESIELPGKLIVRQSAKKPPNTSETWAIPKSS
jgi:hypothetical protein